VLKRNAADRLLPAIRTVAAGGTYIDPVFESKQQGSPPEQGGTPVRDLVAVPAATADALSVDELAVLQRVAWGWSNREIAEQLGMALTELTTHKTQAMQKLGLRTLCPLAQFVSLNRTCSASRSNG